MSNSTSRTCTHTVYCWVSVGTCFSLWKTLTVDIKYKINVDYRYLSIVRDPNKYATVSIQFKVLKLCL